MLSTSKCGCPGGQADACPSAGLVGVSSSYFVHLLRPTAETAVQPVIADAEPRVGRNSSNKSPRRNETKGDASASQAPPRAGGLGHPTDLA